MHKPQTQQPQRTMGANLNGGQFMAARATLATLLEKKSLENLLGSESPRVAATFYAVNRASYLFMKNGLGVQKVERVTVWEEGGKPVQIEVISVKMTCEIKMKGKDGKPTTITEPVIWRFPVPSFKTVAPMVVKTMPVATPKRADGTPAVVITRETLLAPTPKVAEVVADHKTPVTCGKCRNNASYDAKVLDANGTEGIKQMKVCRGCHDVMVADPSLAIEAVALS